MWDSGGFETEEAANEFGRSTPPRAMIVEKMELLE